MKFIFFGTPQPAVEILDILKRHNLVPALIVTNPDKPQGRHLKFTPSPVKEWALQNNISLLQPESASDSDFLYKLKAISYQLFVVVAYGQILRKELLDIPKHGTLNVHYSLLPKYRGASPIESQILADDKNAGISIMLLDEAMDHGPIIAQERLKIHDSRFMIQGGLAWPPTATELRKASNEVAGKLLADIMSKWVAGEITPKEQNHSEATYTKKFTKSDGEIDFANDPYKNFLKIQAFEGSIGTFFYSPFPKGSTRVGEGEGFKSSASEDFGPSFKKGGTEEKKIRVIIKSAEFKDGKLTILRVIPEGKKETDYTEFLRGIQQ